VVWILLVKRGHHLFEGPLVVGDLAGIREGVSHAHGSQVLLQLADKDVPQRHGGGPDLGADHLELAGDPLRGLCHLRVAQGGKQIRVLGDAGDHRHQVRLTRAVVTNDKKRFVIGGLIELQVRENDLG